MTYSEYMSECINYRYSKEYFNLSKEIKEIELRQIYLESAKSNIRGDNYFESTDEDIYMFETSLGNRIKDVASKIWKRLSNIWKVFVDFKKRITEKFKHVIDKILGRNTNTENDNNIFGKLSRMTLDNSMCQNLIKTINLSLNEICKDLIELIPNKQLSPKVKFKGVDSKTRSQVQELLSLLDPLKSGKISIRLKDERLQNHFYIYPDENYQICYDICNFTNVDSINRISDIKKVEIFKIDYLPVKEYQTHADNMAATVDLNIKKINDNIKSLDIDSEMIGKLNQFLADFTYFQGCYVKIMTSSYNFLLKSYIELSKIINSDKPLKFISSNDMPKNDTLYYYNTYMYSPTGFQYLMIERDSNQYKYIGSFPEIIKREVDYGCIQGIVGKIPNSGIYVLCNHVVRLSNQPHRNDGQIDISDMITDREINYAIKLSMSTMNPAQFDAWIDEGSTVKEAISKVIFSMDNKYDGKKHQEFSKEWMEISCGYRIIESKLPDVFNGAFGSILAPLSTIKKFNKENLYVKVLGHSQIDDVCNVLNLKPKNLVLVNDKWYMVKL